MSKILWTKLYVTLFFLFLFSHSFLISFSYSFQFLLSHIFAISSPSQFLQLEIFTRVEPNRSVSLFCDKFVTRAHQSSFNSPAVTPILYSPLNSPRWPMMRISSSLTQMYVDYIVCRLHCRDAEIPHLVRWHFTGLCVSLAASAVAIVRGMNRPTLPP